MEIVIVWVALIFIIASIIDSDRKKKQEAIRRLDVINKMNRKFDEFVDRLVENGVISREERNRVLRGNG